MKHTFSSRLSVICVTAFLVASACDGDEERLTPGDTVAITEEATVDTYYQDMDDLGAVVVAAPTDDEYSGGRATGEIVIEGDNRFCDGVVVTITPDANSTLEHPMGIITVDFGSAGCTDLRGNTRKGKLIFDYDGWRFESGSTVTLTTDNYSINGVRLEGTRTSTNITANQNDPPKFRVVLENGIATFSDNSFATRESDITWSWIREANPAQDKLIVLANSVASGITRNGTPYEVSLLEQLQYNRFCGMAVSGTKKYIIDGDKEITIDYGDGDCDNEVTVTVNGVTRTITIG